MRHTGRIGKWKADKGYGFIRPDDKTYEVFVHVRDFKNRSRNPVAGDHVSYNLSLDAETRLQAMSVRFLDEGRLHFSLPRANVMKSIFVLAYALVLAFLVHTSRLPLFVPMIILALSLLTYLEYRYDKRASEQRRWRTTEGRLHFLSLLGGWPGALIAQSMLRHKSSKSDFRIVFYLTMLLNIFALGGAVLLFRV